MKKFIVTLICIATALGTQAQSRKHIANFSLFQQYFNPALTGYEGSVIKTLYRNQWTGFEDAPKTIFASGELNLEDLATWKKTDESGSQPDTYRQPGGGHAFGISLLHDRFGPFSETQVNLSYGSSVQLSEALSLRWGGALTYSSYYLDGNSLTLDQENDPEYAGLFGQDNRTAKADLNLGLMLTAENYYIGYAMQDVTKGKLITTGDNYLKDTFQQQHVIQAGYRTALSDDFGLVANAIYRYDAAQKETMEGQLKGVYQNTIWAGAGYRKDLAYSLTAGLRLNQLKIAYVYENPVRDASQINKSTNEISLSYNLAPVKHTKQSRQVTIW